MGTVAEGDCPPEALNIHGAAKFTMALPGGRLACSARQRASLDQIPSRSFVP